MSIKTNQNSLTDEEIFLDKAKNLRPFYFIVVCWGEEYINFLFNFCIPSLLAPQNLPVLHNREKNKFLIATTDEDWKRMQSRHAFQLLKQYAEPVHVPMSACPEGVSSCVHMGIGHKSATQIAFDARAYSVLLTPDLMLSEGTMAAVQRHAVSGIEVVLVAALRFAEEPLFENLESMGIAGRNSTLGDEGRALIATGRQFVSAGIKSFHSETLRYEWDSPYFSTFPVACWWQVPKEDGILLHCLSWAPLLVDYNAIDHHDSSMLDNWTIDGDYVYRNFGLEGKVHVVQDSDEAMLVSWAPLKDREQSLKPVKGYTSKLFGSFLKGLVLNGTYTNNVFDPLKRLIFLLPVYWHSRDLNNNWEPIEQKAISVFDKYLPLPTNSASNLTSRKLNNFGIIYSYRRAVLPVLKGHSALVKFSIRFSTSIVNFLRFINYYWSGRSRILLVIYAAIKGDEVAREKFMRHFKYFLGIRPS